MSRKVVCSVGLRSSIVSLESTSPTGQVLALLARGVWSLCVSSTNANGGQLMPRLARISWPLSKPKQAQNFSGPAPTFAALFAALKHKHRLDADGLCTASVEILLCSAPEAFVGRLSSCMATCAFFDCTRIAARVYGKTSSIAYPKDTRCILPLPSVLQHLDAMLAHAVHESLSSMPCLPRAVWFGGAPGSQCMDVSWTVQVAAEKMLDSRSTGAIASAGTARFYDSIPLIRLCRALTSIGILPALVAVILLMHLVVSVEMAVLPSVASIAPRTVGVWTGSRVGNAAGRVPVELASRKRASFLRACAWKCDGTPIGLMTWADNL